MLRPDAADATRAVRCVFALADLWAVLRKLWLARRPTVIIVNHDLYEAAFLAGRVLVNVCAPRPHHHRAHGR